MESLRKFITTLADHPEASLPAWLTAAVTELVLDLSQPRALLIRQPLSAVPEINGAEPGRAQVIDASPSSPPAAISPVAGSAVRSSAGMGARGMGAKQQTEEARRQMSERMKAAWARRKARKQRQDAEGGTPQDGGATFPFAGAAPAAQHTPEQSHADAAPAEEASTGVGPATA